MRYKPTFNHKAANLRSGATRPILEIARGKTIVAPPQPAVDAIHVGIARILRQVDIVIVQRPRGRLELDVVDDEAHRAVGKCKVGSAGMQAGKSHVAAGITRAPGDWRVRRV